MRLNIRAAAALFVCVNAGAQDFFSWEFGMPEPAAKESKVKFLQVAYFDHKLDNTEVDEGNEQFTESRTLY